MFIHNRLLMTLTFCGVISLCSINAQSITIEGEEVPVEFYRIPDQPLDPKLITYSASIMVPGSDLAAMGLTDKELLDKYVVLDGYPRTYTDGDMHIKVTIGNMVITGEKMDSRKTRSVDREGNQVTKHEFFMILDYALPVSYKITDRKGNLITDQSIADISQKREYKTTYYSNDVDLDNQWRVNKSLKMDELRREMIREYLGKLREQMNKEYGFMTVKENARFENIGKKKHPDYAVFNEQINKIKTALSKMKPESDLNTIRAELQPVIDFYIAADQKYPASDKEAVKLKHIALYNLASLYYWLDDFDESKKYVGQLLGIDAADKEALKLKADIEATKSALASARKASRHKVMAQDRS